MAFFRKLMLITTALSLSFAVHTANYFFYNNGRIDGNGSDAFIKDTVENNEDILDMLFPEVEDLKPAESTTDDSSEDSSKPSDNEGVPDNMTYSSAEFSKFKDTFLAETKDAGSEYFKDKVFCGDSLTYGLGLDARFFKDYDVIAWGGLSVYDYLDYKERPSYNQLEELKSPIEWLKELSPKTIYIMLGTNGIAVWSNESHIKMYSKMLDRIQEAVPTATIVLVGITPWGSWRNTETFNGQKVDNFNMMLLEMAYERGMYYLNFGQATRDDNGNFREELCSDDGIHWQKACKQLYLEYIRTHAIP